jgi:6-phosphofructokinase 2
VTMNPALDLSTSTGRVVPTHKIRCEAPQRHPGGGGVNVARVVHRLGARCAALYPSGGASGQVFQQLLDEEGVASICVSVSGETRESFSVKELATQNEFRFVLPGPEMHSWEWQACIDRVLTLDALPRYLVASGSLPPGVPLDFYAQLIRRLKLSGVNVLLDTSGQALFEALEEGVYLIKPSLRELSELCGKPLSTETEWCREAQQLIKQGKAQVVVLSLGEGGAWLFSAGDSWFAPALPVKVVSAIGAGDSFVGAMVWALSKNFELIDAFRYGVAGASAALLSIGTGLCHPDDVTRLYRDVSLVKH